MEMECRGQASRVTTSSGLGSKPTLGVFVRNPDGQVVSLEALPLSHSPSNSDVP